jgi:hypothetical protein
MNTKIATYFAETPGGLRAASLLRTHKINPRALLAVIESEVLDAAPHLFHGALYSTEDLCGPELWDRLHYDGAKRAAGMCMAYLVECRAVPLMLHITASGKGPKRYKLSPVWKPRAALSH